MARALPAELSKLELSDRTVTFELEEGEVVAEKQWSETNVGYTAQRNYYGDQWLSGINSRVTEILELFIRTDSGREVSQRLYDSGLSARAGNKVALLKADGKLYRVYNLDIGKWGNVFKLSDSVASRAPAPKVPGKFNSVVRFLLVGVLAGYVLYSGFVGWADYLTGAMADKLMRSTSIAFGGWTFSARSTWFMLLISVFSLPALLVLSRLIRRETFFPWALVVAFAASTLGISLAVSMPGINAWLMDKLGHMHAALGAIYSAPVTDFGRKWMYWIVNIGVFLIFWVECALLLAVYQGIAKRKGWPHASKAGWLLVLSILLGMAAMGLGEMIWRFILPRSLAVPLTSVMVAPLQSLFVNLPDGQAMPWLALVPPFGLYFVIVLLILTPAAFTFVAFAWFGKTAVLQQLSKYALVVIGWGCVAYISYAMAPKFVSAVHYDMLKRLVQHDYNGWDAGSLFFFLTGFKGMLDVSAFFAALNGVLIGAVSAGKASRRRKAALQEAEQRGEEAFQNIFKIKAHLDRINHFVMKQAG